MTVQDLIEKLMRLPLSARVVVSKDGPLAHADSVEYIPEAYDDTGYVRDTRTDEPPQGAKIFAAVEIA